MESDDIVNLDTGFAVFVSTNCPHTESIKDEVNKILTMMNSQDQHTKCNSCDHLLENWICLKCGIISCGRNVKGHAKEHNTQTSHCIALSLADLSCWCYDCNSYIEHSITNPIVFALHKKKFSSPHPKEQN